MSSIVVVSRVEIQDARTRACNVQSRTYYIRARQQGTQLHVKLKVFHLAGVWRPAVSLFPFAAAAFCMPGEV